MKKIILAAFAAFALAGQASAFELGKTGVFLDNTTTLEYSLENSDWNTTTHELNLNYTLENAPLTVYALTEVDLRDVEFAGLEVGVDYFVERAGDLTLNAAIRTDANLDYTDAVIGAEFKF